MVPICQLILASASPRRQNLLRMLGLDFKVMVSTFEEKMDLYSSTPEELVMQMARGKAEEVWKITSARQETSDGLVLGADTIVVMNGEYLGKPDHEEEARKMLTSLAGRWHQVFTGLALVHRKKSVVAYEMTKVHFRTLSTEEIDGYLRTGEPMDKAGAYGIQGVGAVLVDRIEGCFYNVMGLPLARLALLLKDYGFNLPEVKTIARTVNKKPSL
ncbi:MAG TPA: septum formation inhibitor Maf [Firmicutes bacterium]|nr:septum formation inhibitor Maf [Bacillota bacterium]HBK67384.1 septum formation inhibitor Maf [Bacillota bacterium]